MVRISPARLNTMSRASRRANPPLPPLGSLCALLIARSRGREAFAEGKESPACTPEPCLPARPGVLGRFEASPCSCPSPSSRFPAADPAAAGWAGAGAGPGRPAAEGRALLQSAAPGGQGRAGPTGPRRGREGGTWGRGGPGGEGTPCPGKGRRPGPARCSGPGWGWDPGGGFALWCSHPHPPSAGAACEGWDPPGVRGPTGVSERGLWETGTPPPRPPGRAHKGGSTRGEGNIPKSGVWASGH